MITLPRKVKMSKSKRRNPNDESANYDMQDRKRASIPYYGKANDRPRDKGISFKKII
jgi:hypothetical protein